LLQLMAWQVNREEQVYAALFELSVDTGFMQLRGGIEIPAAVLE